MKLQEIRKNKGITQEELAESCGISRSAIGMIETGGMNPSMEVARTICNVLQCTLDELFGGDE